MATQAESQVEPQPNQKVVVASAPESPIQTPTETQEIPEFNEKEFPSLNSPNSESSKDSEAEAKLLDRINSIPMVVEGLNLIKGFVKDDTKTYNRFIKYAYNTAETAFTSATEIVESRFPNQVNAADQLASKSLDYLEDQFPVVFHQSSSEVYETSKQAISQIVATPTAAIDSTLVTVANSAEAVLDRFLPVPTEEKEELSKDAGIARLRHVGVDAQRRVVKVVRSQIDNISSVTTGGSILQMRESNAYIQRASDEIASISEGLTTLITKAKDNIGSIKESSGEIIYQAQSNLTQRLKTEIDSVYKYINDNSNKLPETVVAQLEPAFNTLKERATKVTQELQRDDQTTLQKANNALAIATESIPIIDNARIYLTSFIVKQESKAAESSN
ncbi:hypothetical protein K502DRAFT_324943 [Neoconidiobolus thromboides FSU 785]|nr:hypothetical protein K502DRAFT_324943 [Neoconidiobolus thromboides FSU 785]